MLSDRADMSIASLANFLVPADGKVRATSAVGFLLKLLKMNPGESVAAAVLKALPAPPALPTFAPLQMKREGAEGANFEAASQPLKKAKMQV